MEDTWAARDLLVLDALVKHFDDPAVDQVRPSEIEVLTGLGKDEVERALIALCEADPAYLVCGSVAELRSPVIVSGVMERARRAVGAWPNPEDLVDRLVSAFTKAAEDEQDPERKSKLRQTAGWLSGALRDVAVQVAATAVGRSVGM